MKRFAWRGAVAAISLVSFAGLASAQSGNIPQIPPGGASRLTWSVGASDTNALNFIETYSLQVTAQSPAWPGYYPEMEDGRRGISVYFPEVKTVRVSTYGVVTSVSSAGGVQMVVPEATGIAWGGTITLSNWEINAVTRQLSADISGTGGLPSQTQVAVFTLDDYTLNGNHTSFSLWLTQAGADAFAQATGLRAFGLSALQGLRQGSFGTISVDVAMVPEPSTYALGLLGGMMVLIGVRRQSRCQARAQAA